MGFKRLVARFSKEGGLIAGLTLATAGLFKIAAFAREAFIASRFGLSSFTDAYFAFQQFPLMLATFMFGAFGLAFIPAYTDEKRRTGHVPWLPGLTVYGGALGVLLTVLMFSCAPLLQRIFSLAQGGRATTTLVILSCCFAPVIWLGIWAGTVIAEGRNLLAMIVTGLPYLSMTALLVGLYALGKLDTLSLPVSFLIGFGAIGLATLPLLRSAERPRNYFGAALQTWKMPGFRRFLRQLTASSIENLGYSANQVLLVYFVAQTGTGTVSANTCAMRVGMLGFSLLSQPLAQLLQARLCAAGENSQRRVFGRWLPAISSAVLVFALLLYVLRKPLTGFVYLHGQFSALELSRVIQIIPSWLAYFVVISLNALAARYLFSTARGHHYVRRQLCAYAAANLIRFASWGRLSAPQVIWCSVLCEGCAFLLNVRNCFERPQSAVESDVCVPSRRVVMHTPEPGSSAALYVEALSAALTAENVPLRVVCPANHQARTAMEGNPLMEVRVCCDRATSTAVSFATKIAQNLRFVVSSCNILLRAANRGDVIHFQYILHLPFGLIFFACARAKRAHIVFTVHDPIPHKFLFPRALRVIEMGALACAYKWSDLLVVHSAAGKRKLMETFQAAPQKIRVVVHGPYELKDKVAACPESNRLEVLFFGSLRENKGLHLAIEAVQQLAAEGVPIRLTIAGQVLNRNEAEYWERCRTSIDFASGAIRLIQSFVPDEELSELFSQCHCFVLPYTTFSSDSGVASIALANARPIVATDAGGLGWLLDHSGGGIHIVDASVAGVKTALRQAVDLGPEILQRMGQAGAQWMSKECSWSKVARDTRDLYAEFIPDLNAVQRCVEPTGLDLELAGSSLS